MIKKKEVKSLSPNDRYELDPIAAHKDPSLFKVALAYMQELHVVVCCSMNSLLGTVALVHPIIAKRWASIPAFARRLSTLWTRHFTRYLFSSTPAPHPYVLRRYSQFPQSHPPQNRFETKEFFLRNWNGKQESSAEAPPSPNQRPNWTGFRRIPGHWLVGPRPS